MAQARDEVPDGRRGGPPRPAPSPVDLATILALLPALGRVALLGGQRLVGETAASAATLPAALGRVATGATTPAEVLAEARAGVVRSLRDGLGVTDLEAAVAHLTGELTERRALAERGRALLERSASLEADTDHPAFGHLIEQVAPDEMRILRVLTRDGEQPVVDVETRGALGGRGRVVADRLTLLAEVAGCKHPEHLEVYLDNLERLGLVRYLDEPLAEGDYDVIEVQEPATTARRRAAAESSSVRSRQRRIGLSALGHAFCAACLPRPE